LPFFFFDTVVFFVAFTPGPALIVDGFFVVVAGLPMPCDGGVTAAASAALVVGE
jgi:hypothetical protein